MLASRGGRQANIAEVLKLEDNRKVASARCSVDSSHISLGSSTYGASSPAMAAGVAPAATALASAPPSIGEVWLVGSSTWPEGWLCYWSAGGMGPVVG